MDQQPQIDITACLDAARMYNAAYHRDRHNYRPDRDNLPDVQEQLKIVSLWEFLLALGRRTGVKLLAEGFNLAMLAAGALMLVNGVKNVDEYVQAQPTTHTWFIAGLPHTWSEPSLHPLPPGWGETNLSLYATLLVVICLGWFGSARLLRKAREIKTGVPIRYADTAHLPAQDTLVRASSEPAQETLVRASELPPTPPDALLRSVGLGQETPPEQMVRPAQKQ